MYLTSACGYLLFSIANFVLNLQILALSVIMLLFEAGMSLGLENQIFQYIDLHQNEFIQTLKEWVAVESDSIQPELRQEVTRMVELTADRLRAMGATVELVKLGSHKLPDGESLPLPPLTLAELGKDPQKPTVCFYGHVDVQPAKKEDGWKTDPYTLTEIDGNLYGRGATDNKGPVLAWINAVESFRALKLVGSKEKHLKEINLWGVTLITVKVLLTVDTGKPTWVYNSMRKTRDLHSGSFGGIIHEPMTDLIALLDSLVDTSGRILIPGVYDDVASLTEEEKKLYEAIEFDLEEYKNNSGVKKFLYDTKEEILSHLWRYPSLSIHGIEGAFHEPGIKTVIPARVIGKFSIRQVPHMDISVGEHQVIKYLEDVFSKRNSPNKLKVSVPISAMPWVADINDPLYTAARMAIKTVFGQNPEMIRDGATIPIAQMFQNITRKSVMMLPIGAADDAEHSQKEKISRLKLKKGAVKDERRN
uniref:Peptidase M20 dimerisation domain-containing protein n=1 Tax=Chelonoidis abingdonii TaxID=106734 RepID=A0A8C0JEQ6_CHEAB